MALASTVLNAPKAVATASRPNASTPSPASLSDPLAFRKFNQAVDLDNAYDTWRWYRTLAQSNDVVKLNLGAFRAVLRLIKGNQVVFSRSPVARVQLLDEVWTAVEKSDVIPDKSLYLTFVELYGRVGDQAGITKVVQAMKAAKEPTDDLLIQQWIMATLARAGSVDEASVIYQKHRDSVGANRSFANAYIAGCARGGHEDAMLRMFKDMQKNGPKPDNGTYNAVIQYYIGKENIAEATKYFEQRIQTPGASTVIYNAMLFAHIRAGDGAKAHALVAQMTAQKLNFDHITFEHLVRLAALDGRTADAWSLVHSMDRRPISLLASLAKATGPATTSPESFEKFKTSLNSTQVQLRPKVLETLLKGYRAIPDAASAEAVLSWFEKAGFPVESRLHSLVVDAYLSQEDVPNAQRIANQDGVELAPRTKSNLLNATEGKAASV
ncbi:hypothetical protein HKX48_000787 [Thoreauomyces humboldtii]|nr:hypothetical protein HKX48_000787 [Thoreauomyces humboldtii]